MFGNLLWSLAEISKVRVVLTGIVTPTMSWNEDLLDNDHRTHGICVVCFKTWSCWSLFSGRTPTRRSQSNVWNSQRLLYVTPKFETKILRLSIFAMTNLMSVAPRLQNLGIALRRRQIGKNKVWNSVEAGHKCGIIKGARKSNVLLTFGKWCLLASNLRLEEREVVVDFGTSLHMISRKDLSDAEMDTLTKSCRPSIVVTSDGEAQAHGEATVYVEELDIFLTKNFSKTHDILMNGSMVRSLIS